MGLWEISNGLRRVSCSLQGRFPLPSSLASVNLGELQYVGVKACCFSTRHRLPLIHLSSWV